MRYQGSKLKMVKILKGIIETVISPSDIYFEPFMGGCNSLAYINHPNKITCDTNKFMVSLWNDIKTGTFTAPGTLSEQQYYDIKNDCLNNGTRYTDALKGYVATACSYGSSWWNGYAKYNPVKHEDHISEAKHGLEKQVKNFIALDKTMFLNSSYDEVQLNSPAFIYCDPPYASTKKYADSFDNEAFWQWAREQVANGHKVLVSEYTAPADFVCIWSKSMQDGMGDSKKKKVERLFVHVSQLSIFNKKKFKNVI